MGYGSAEIEVAAGQEYTIMVKNWGSAVTNDYTITTYGESAKVTMS